MHSIPLSCTSSPCNLLVLNLGIYTLVQATVGIGTVLILDFCVAFPRGDGGGGIKGPILYGQSPFALSLTLPQQLKRTGLCPCQSLGNRGQVKFIWLWHFWQFPIIPIDVLWEATEGGIVGQNDGR